MIGLDEAPVSQRPSPAETLQQRERETTSRRAGHPRRSQPTPVEYRAARSFESRDRSNRQSEHHQVQRYHVQDDARCWTHEGLEEPLIIPKAPASCERVQHHALSTNWARWSSRRPCGLIRRQGTKRSAPRSIVLLVINLSPDRTLNHPKECPVIWVAELLQDRMDKGHRKTQVRR